MYTFDLCLVHVHMDQIFILDKSKNDWQTNIHNRVLLRHLGDGIYNVRLNRPEKMNALDMQMFESIGQAAQLLRDSRTLTTTSSTVTTTTTTTTTTSHHPRIETPVRAIILNGQGKAFCTGLDVKGMLNVKNGNPKRHLDRLLTRPSGYQRNDDKKDSTSNMLEREKDTVLREVPAEDTSISSPTILGNLAQDVSYLWRDIDVPVIASVHGMCFGRGMQIALGVDMRFATTDCRLSMTASITLRELVRIDIAKELTMTGRIVSGREGDSLGLVTMCVEDPFEESLKVAKEIVARCVLAFFV